MLILLPGLSSARQGEKVAARLGTAYKHVQMLSDPATSLLSDDLTIQDIEDFLRTHDMTEQVVVSGYPLNVIQARSLDIALAAFGQCVSLAVEVESGKNEQNRENRALFRYYRTQNKLVVVDKSTSTSEICQEMTDIYARRRTSR